MMVKAAPRVIIFDCDGVLFASEAANLAFYNHIFKFFGRPVVAADDSKRLKVLHTYSSHQVFEHFFGRGQRYEEVLTYARTVDYRQFIPLMEPQPGLHAILGRLKEGYRLGIATNRTDSMALISLHFQLQPYFQHLVTAGDVPRPKPHPDMLHRALELFQVEPQAALYIGDSDLDYQASRAAGIPFIGFGYQPADAPAVESLDVLEDLLD
ncbi:MAG: HAD family hydrolase [Pseudomonadota bacterium]|nr:HAD family hydrolase [Pseudomonadota bacterium]